MSELSRSAHNRIKGAQRHLIDRCGGIGGAVEITSYGKSNVGRWNNPTDPDLMPISAVLALEADCGEPLVTAVMAELNGRRLSDPDGDEAAPATVFSRHAETVRRAGELMAAGAQAFSDGRVTPTEMLLLGQLANDLQSAVADLQMALASGKAEGGQVVSFGRVAE